MQLYFRYNKHYMAMVKLKVNIWRYYKPLIGQGDFNSLLNLTNDFLFLIGNDFWGTQTDRTSGTEF